MCLCGKASNSKPDQVQIQKAQRVGAFAVHPQCSASYCLGAADDSFLTSDPGIESDAHTTVGVVGLHGNFPCATGAVTETEGGKGVSRTPRPNADVPVFYFQMCQAERPPSPHPELRLDSKLPGVHAAVKAGADNLAKLFSTIILSATHIVIHNIVIFTNLSVSLSDGSKISLTYLHQYNYTLLHCDYDSLQLSD